MIIRIRVSTSSNLEKMKIFISAITFFAIVEAYGKSGPIRGCDPNQPKINRIMKSKIQKFYPTLGRGTNRRYKFQLGNIFNRCPETFVPYYEEFQLRKAQNAKINEMNRLFENITVKPKPKRSCGFWKWIFCWYTKQVKIFWFWNGLYESLLISLFVSILFAP